MLAMSQHTIRMQHVTRGHFARHKIPFYGRLQHFNTCTPENYTKYDANQYNNIIAHRSITREQKQLFLVHKSTL